ncbi:TonB-dependent receptor plug domain-containing protein [Pseudobacteriovorax antillogorgiicola]|uniref:Outer membrane receptor proteins, mostly Fe transport n=1 Tax=Pseudobacteriovorax antillogorgiicola TaxID=1513793 RepID=A0A1Y6CLK7_9BACT|nr:TonB-dependent receptor [Pseudobacteriovorax antillogorgiicola]TCS47245.1 outer membrane receptor protein involved in Fe transport [Pseudobacteriovorax antillogorgiicola]SMF62009.1 Outer membrane receptor proteins, mostly Fe transport [Pseudobacteriovorax antillogorgiicola]
MSTYSRHCVPALLTLVMGSAAYGQNEVEITDDNAIKKAERISVVGSRIKRSELEGPEQVIRIDRDAIKATGHNSLAEVIRDLPQNSFGSFVDDGTNATTPNLRGVGSANTLLLIDGRRMVKDANNERADISMIPLAAVEEVQVLLGGASAIYGSDALGGVINIVTRRDYDGTLLSGSYTGTRDGGGEEAVASAVWGSSSESSSSFNVVQYRKIQPLFWNDRSWIDSDEQFGIGDPASYVGIDKKSYTLAPCSVPDPDNENLCGSDWAKDWNYFQAEVEQITGFSQYQRAISENHTFNASFFLLSKEINESSTANFFRRDLVPVSLLKEMNPKVAPLEVSDGKVQATGFINTAGPRLTTTYVKTYSAAGGFEGYLSDTLDYSVNLAYADSVVQSETRNALVTSQLNEAMEDGLYNPFKPVGEQGSLDSATTNVYGNSRTMTTTFDAGLSGLLFENWAGAVEFAAGYNFVKENMNVDDGQAVLPYGEENKYRIFGYSGTKRDAERMVNSAYVEFKVPLAQTLSLTTAGRIDSYSDVGNSTTPAASLEYRPTNNLLLRTSYTEGFKAPTLDDINSPLNKSFDFGRDYVVCGDPKDTDTDYCEGTQAIDTFVGGNDQLDPETSQSISLGFVWDATEQLAFSGDYYEIEVKDEIQAISIDNALRYERDGKTPTGIDIIRDSDGRLSSITLPLLNLGKTISHGWDLGVRYSMTTSFGRLAFDDNLAVKTVSKWQSAPGERYIDDLRDEPRWRNTAGVTWSVLAHQVRLANNHIDARRDRADETGKVPSYNTWDLNYAYSFTGGSRISLGGNNVTQVRPPIDESSTSGLSKGITPSLYGIKGPSYYMQVEYAL